MGLIIYPLGIPASYASLLRLKHKKLVVKDEDERNKDESIAHLKFLWGSYESRYYWWEVVEMARKLVLTGLLVIFLEGSVLQLCTGLVVTVVSLVIYANICPYSSRTDDVLQLFCLAQLFITLLSGMVLKVNLNLTDSSSREAAEPGQSEMLGIVLIALNASCLVMGAGAVIMEAGDACGGWNKCTRSKKVRAVKVAPVMPAVTKESKDDADETVEALKQQLATQKAAYNELQAKFKAELDGAAIDGPETITPLVEETGTAGTV